MMISSSLGLFDPKCDNATPTISNISPWNFVFLPFMEANSRPCAVHQASPWSDRCDCLRILIRSVSFFSSSLFCVSSHLSLMSFQSARSCVQRASTAEPRLSGPAVLGPGHNRLAAAQPNPLEQPQGEQADLLDGGAGRGGLPPWR